MINYQNLRYHKHERIIAGKSVHLYTLYKVSLRDYLHPFYANELVQLFNRLAMNFNIDIQLSYYALSSEIGLYNNMPNQPRFSKRLSAWAHRVHNVKLPDILVSKVATYMKDNTITRDYYFEFSRVVDWRAGEFGDRHSCFFRSKRRATAVLHRAGALPVRFYYDDQMKIPVGRCFLLPLNDSAFAVFNTYNAETSSSGYGETTTFNNNIASTILATFFGENGNILPIERKHAMPARNYDNYSQSITMWYNDDAIYLVGNLKNNTNTYNWPFAWRVDGNNFYSYYKSARLCKCRGHASSVNTCSVCRDARYVQCNRCQTLTETPLCFGMCLSCLMKSHAYDLLNQCFVDDQSNACDTIVNTPHGDLRLVNLPSTCRVDVVNYAGRAMRVLQVFDPSTQTYTSYLATFAHQPSQENPLVWEKIVQTYNGEYHLLNNCLYVNNQYVELSQRMRYFQTHTVNVSHMTYSDYVQYLRARNNVSRGAIPLNN